LSDAKTYVAPLDINQILEILPHRIPFVLIDRVLELREGFVVCQKNVTVNEWFFQGHFPVRPVMPGVLMIEAMAQAAAVLVLTEPEHADKLALLVGVDGARFRKIVSPGDVLRIEVKELVRRRNIGRAECKILVDGQLVCEAVLTFGFDVKPATA
jgi:3-hydroxyacyl-[acyl-carrier-protein] dehydratase